jgi:outer membrane biogenesis lipoprotein LolB
MINTMKKKLITAASLALIACAVIAAEPNVADQKTAADQKWLTVVQKIAEKGQTKISTPSEARVTLLKNWAAMNGYSVEVTKTEAGFKLDVTRNIAKN